MQINSGIRRRLRRFHLLFVAEKPPFVAEVALSA
jgi:hypothetical protein